MRSYLKSFRAFAASSLALGLLVTSASAFADDHGHGKPTAVPEINAKYAGAALVLVLGGAAVVLGRRRRAVG